MPVNFLLSLYIFLLDVFLGKRNALLINGWSEIKPDVKRDELLFSSISFNSVSEISISKITV